MSLDRSAYSHLPRLDVATAVALGIALLDAKPPEVTPALTKSRKRMRTAVVALQAAWAERDKKRGQHEPLDLRSLDARVDNAWAALHAILQALSWLPADKSNRFASAARLLSNLFPNGKGFLTLPYAAEWTESQKRLDRIEKEGLAEELSRLCGADVVEELRQAHREYGKAVGKVLQGAGEVDTVGLREPLQRLTRTIEDYCIKVLATAEPDDPATEQAVRKALKPIEIIRERASRSAGSSSNDADLPPAGPTSAVPAAG